MRANFKKKLKIFLLLAAVIGLLVFFNGIHGQSIVRNSLLKIISPFSRSAQAAVDFLFSSFKTLAEIKNLSLENADLKNENKELLAELTRWKELARDNEALRAQLGVTGKKSYSLMSAEIVSYDPVSLTYSLTVNRGAKDGVAEGMPVIAPGNVLLGKVSRVYDDFATVALIADKDNKVGARSERVETSGVLSGAAGNSLLMDLIEKKSDIEAGDLILTSGLDGVYPRDLIIGRVARISQSEEGIFKQAYIAAAYSEFKGAGVFIILK